RVARDVNCALLIHCPRSSSCHPPSPKHSPAQPRSHPLATGKALATSYPRSNTHDLSSSTACPGRASISPAAILRAQQAAWCEECLASRVHHASVLSSRDGGVSWSQ